MRFIYEARRKLATGHILSDEYEIAVAGEVIDPQFEVKRKDTFSLDGTAESDLQHINNDWFVTTDLIADGQPAENFLEFIGSTLGGAGETFTFDPLSDTVGVDIQPTLVWMVSKRFRRSRRFPQFFQYQLRMREV